MAHRSHYKPKRSPGGPPWGKDASSAQPTAPGPNSLSQVAPVPPSAPPSIPGRVEVTTVEPGNDAPPEGVGEYGRFFVRAQR